MATVTVYVVLSSSPSSKNAQEEAHGELAGSGRCGFQLLIQPLGSRPSIEGRYRAASSYG